MSENLNPIVLEVEEVRVVNAVSPTVDLGRTENGALVTVHDYRGTQTVEILDGPVGPVGPQGPQGESGAETAKAIVEEAISRMEDSIHDAQTIGQTVAGYRDAAAQSASNAALSKDAAALSAQAAEQSNQSSSGYARTAGEHAENAAQSAQAASQSATAADTSASNAAQSETNAGSSAQAASQSAQAASQSATNAAQSERNAADSAQDAHDVLDSIPEDYSQMSADVADLQTSVANLNDRKANIDGYYQDMTVGDAEQLVSSQMVEDSVPYLFRKSGGSKDIGNRAYLDKIVGGTEVWNQLINANTVVSSYTKVGITYSADGNGKITLDGTTTNVFSQVFGTSAQIINGHVYFPKLGNIVSRSSGDVFMINNWDVTLQYGRLVRAYASASGPFGIRVGGAGLTFSGDYYPQIFDITAMFGTTIADYIYSLEQANAGAGVEWLRNLFPAEYYPYNAGELISVSGLSEHIMRDADSNVIGRYPLDSSLTLRGIPKLDAENNLYYDGDEYTPDGKVNRRYGIVDLGTLNWNRRQQNDIYLLTANVPSMITTYGYGTALNSINIIGLQYTYKGRNIGWDAMPDDSFGFAGNNLRIRDDSYTDSATFKTAMSGVMLVYELATPVEETAEPYHETQIVDAFGTEEFVSTSIVPVGHLTEYPANLRDKLEHLPDLASVDGVYMIHQQSGQMSLTPHPIPLAPSTDGTYTLKATVSNGTVTYVWEAVT